MGKRGGYGQYCGLARAVETLGERWAFLIVRDLLVAPKRFSDLQRGLPGIPNNVLTKRLDDLEQAGVIRRRVIPRPERGIAYEMTEYGRELEDILIALGRWGAKSMKEPRPGEIITTDALISALRATFRPESARGIKAAYELRVGPIVIYARVSNGKLQTGPGPIERRDLVIEASPAIRALMAGELTPADSIASGNIHVTGDEKLLETFARIFRIDSFPAQPQ
jgi:DNA-binding HxlR family transcriptional regulator